MAKSTNLDFSRKDKEAFASKFAGNSVAKPWPPSAECASYVSGVLGDLLLEEFKNIVKPQLDAMKTTMNTASIIPISMEVPRASTDFAETPIAHYGKVSDAFFAEVERVTPELLGKEDTCHGAWL